MRSTLFILFLSLFLALSSASLPSLNKIYSIWYCGEDGCSWASQPNLANTNWLLNRGDGTPTVNIIIFSFIDPAVLVQSPSGIPKGFTQTAVEYFKGKGIYVLFSIGGAAYSTNWDRALATNAAQLARNAASVAKQFGVGIEIDYETDGAASLNLLDTFVKTYRQQIPYQSGMSPSPESILTVDLGAGTGYLTDLSVKTAGWLNGSTPYLNWANAMVSGDANGDNTQYWQQHLNGANWANLPPMQPHQLVGSLYASSGAVNCKNYQGTVLQTAVTWSQSHQTRGLSFWAAGCPAPPSNCAVNCTGIQQGSKAFLG